tara:strand:- start:221 stop:988 length:768 start_codon:yes stop_codon:yes gene_type:complete
MKWFKHQATANMDAKLQEILLDYGLEGYGLYWYCIELIANDVEPEKLNFELEHDCRVIARNTGSTVQRVQEMMTKFVDVGLFENSTGVITCLKLARVSDDYTAKLIRSNQATGRMVNGVRQTPTNSDKNPLEESKTKESRADNSNQKEAIDYSSLCMTDNQIIEVKRIRKQNKGGKITQRVIDGLAKEFEKAAGMGLGAEQILTEWEMRGWKSFKAEWCKPNGFAKADKFDQNVGALQNIQFAPHQQTEGLLTND